MAQLTPPEQSYVISLLSQLPSILMACAAFVAAMASAWQTYKNTTKVNAVSSQVEKVDETTKSTHSLINSRFDQWRQEIREASVTAVTLAHEAGVRLGVEQMKLKSDIYRDAFSKGLEEGKVSIIPKEDK